MKRYIILLALTTLCSSCGKEEVPPVSGDYRESYIGTYEGQKSPSSFYSDPLAMDIELTVAIDTTDDSYILVNEQQVMVHQDGTFGEGPLEGLIFGDSIKFYTRPIVNGLILPCFIKGRKK